MMAVSQLQSNLALSDWGNVAEQQQRFWVDALQPSSALSRMCNVVTVKQRLLLKGGYVLRSCPPGKQNGRGQCLTRAVATEGNLSGNNVSGSNVSSNYVPGNNFAGSSQSGNTFSSAADGLPPKERQEKLWQDFFLDPTQWWDNRPDKKNPRYPDFRHRRSKQPLWLNDRLKPAWVDSLLAMWDSRVTERSVDPRLIARIVGTEVPETGEAGADGNGAAKAARDEVERLAGMSVEDLVAATTKLAEDARVKEAVEGLDLLVQRGAPVEIGLFYRVLKRCIEHRDLDLGRRVHGLIVKGGFESNTFLANHLICMYASHQKLEDSMKVFNNVMDPDRYLWAAIIFAHNRHGEPADAMQLYQKMRRSPVRPDNHIFVAILKACATAGELAFGRELHADIQRSEHVADRFVGSGLVAMYARCGSLEEASQVFEGLRKRDMVSWNSMIVGNLLQGNPQVSLAYYARMQEEGVTPADRGTFLALLQACAGVGALQLGRQLQEQIKEKGGEGDVAVCNCLINMYARCGSLEEARKVFDGVEEKDSVTWNALLNGYAENKDYQKTLQVFEEMEKQKIELDDTTFLGLLLACNHGGLVDEGRRYFKMMLDNSSITPSSQHYKYMIDLLGRSGHLDEAEKMMENAPAENEVIDLWITLLSACKDQGDIERGRRCFEQIISKEPGNAAAYVLLGDLYANAGRWEDVEKTEISRKAAEAWRTPAKAFIEVDKKVREFTVEEERSGTPASSTLERSEGGYNVAQAAAAVSDQDREDSLCGHVEKVALAYGLLNTPDGTPLLVTTNLRMCNDCHSTIKTISRVEKREVVIRDAQCVHRFLDGSCSCGDGN